MLPPRASGFDMKKAYEGAMDQIGSDKDAGDLWKDWIKIVEAEPAHNVHEEQQKMDMLRKIYRRAVQIPLHNVEQLWRELDTFENKLNKLTVRLQGVVSLQWTLTLNRLKNFSLKSAKRT